MAMTAGETPGDPDGREPHDAGVRLVKRYANRKLYDTEARKFTSLRRLERLIRDGVDVRIVDHVRGDDLTVEVLAGIVGAQPGDDDGVALLTTLIRAPRELVSALVERDQRAHELEEMWAHVSELTRAVDRLLAEAER